MGSEEFVWRQVSRATDGFPRMMLRFVHDVYGPEVIDEAWDEFTVWADDGPEFDTDSPDMPLFMPWFFHRWAPDPNDTIVDDASLHDRTPTSVLLERRAARLDPVLRRYLEGCMRAPFSFHEITGCDPGHGFRTRDVFTHEERQVLERSASRFLRVGDILFGQLVDTDGITLLEACATRTIPPGETLELVDLRANMARGTGEVTHDDLEDWSIEVREAYHDIMDRLLNRQVPRLQNTDGEDIAWHRLIFDVDSTAEAFAALEHLSAHDPDAEVIDSASYGDDGTLQRVSFAWSATGNRAHAHWSNTVLGQIEIDGGRLSAQVNSAERAARLKQLIENSLGDRARYRATEIQSVESALKAHRQRDADPDDTDDSERSPELDDHIQALLAAHYERWPSENIPALDGRTPLEAVRDEHGREKVRILIAQIERNGRRMKPPLDSDTVRRLRERLGLN